MGIDASIALGVKPAQFENPVNRMAQILQIQGAQQDQALKSMQADEYRRGIGEKLSLNDAYRTAVGADGTVDRNKLYTTLASGGHGSQLPAVQKTFMELDKSQAEVRKNAAEGYKLFQNTIGAQFNNPQASKESVLGAVSGLVQSGAFDPVVAQKLVASLPEDPQQLRMHLRQVLTTQMTPEQMLTVFAPKPEKIDNGQQIGFVDTNPNSPTYGKQTAGGVTQKVADPNAVLGSTTSIENNKRTVGASYANASATRAVAQATRDAAQIKGNQDTEMKLGDDYRAQSKNFKETADAYKQISAVLDKATVSPAATLAGATKFMKMIDPGSVVRESELGMALAATGVFDRASNYFNTLQHGKVLTPSQVADFKNITKQINDAAASQQKLIDNHFASVAKQYGLRPEMVVQDFGQGGNGGAAPSVPNGWSVIGVQK